AFVLPPLMRSRPTAAAPSDSASNLAIFRAQKKEIEADCDKGLISSAERDTALAELSARLLEAFPTEAFPAEAAPVEAAVPPSSKPAWVSAALLAAAIPAVSIVLYTVLGTPAALDPNALNQNAAKATPRAASGPVDAQGAEPTEADIINMVDNLAEKMKERPDDATGWAVLARSQSALGRYAEAADAFERAVKLSPPDAQLLADYADTLVGTQQGRFDGKPYALIQQALKLDAKNIKVLALAATAEFRMGNRSASIQYWEKLKALLPPDSEDRREVDALIAEVKGEKAAPGAAKPAPVQVAGASVTGQVSIAPELATQVAPGDTLFIFARAVNGPKIPLAVMRIPAPKQWPQAFELTDAMAMAPGMNLSAFAEVTIEARISKSGDARPQPGDLEGQSGAVKPGSRDIRLTLSRRVP
ncbi:MAG: c-type cytochrome biogenesis protein CcmI, partial [Betaproteobacteria bacterium]|nr:c-type cytochrome biogenesis protein CcmI [Betaproteobacteria bacterium]